MRSKKYKGRVVTLKVRFSDFKTMTKRLTLNKYTYSMFDIHRSSVGLLKNIDLDRKKVRLVGISVSGLKPTVLLEDLLSSEVPDDENLTEAINRISDKFGEDKLTIAKMVEKDVTMD
jgi:DNA polymerase-4